MIRLEVRAALPYAEIAAQVLAYLKGRPIPVDQGPVRGQLRVEDVRIRPSGGHLAVTVGFVADLAWPLPQVRGSVHGTARPDFDEATQSVRLRDVALTADVDPVLARAVFASRRRRMQEALADLSLDVQPTLERLRDGVNAGLAGPRRTPGVAVEGAVDAVRVEGILVSDDLIVVASATGRLRVKLEAPHGEPRPTAP